MTATSAVLLQMWAAGIVGGIALAFLAYLFGFGKAVLITAAVVFGALLFWITIPIQINAFYRKAPAIERGGHRA
jgi:hypothetical protein